jgi:G3E family GTPase
MKKRGKFDYILLETTGLADPGEDLCIITKNEFAFVRYLTSPS